MLNPQNSWEDILFGEFEEEKEKEENIISKEEFLALGNQIDSSDETQATESSTDSGSESGSSGSVQDRTVQPNIVKVKQLPLSISATYPWV